MDARFESARALLHAFKGDSYVYGPGCFGKLGHSAAVLGKRVAVIADGAGTSWAKPLHQKALASLAATGVTCAGDLIAGADPNAPREDVQRIASALRAQAPEAVIAIGGGSVIDAAKAACAMVALSPEYADIEQYFGVGNVSKLLAQKGVSAIPLLAVQLAASSGAHLTKYSNVTDVHTHQKKLIVDDAIIPRKALFDYATTVSMPAGFTADGALDGVAHCLEVFFGSKGDALDRARPVALLGIELVAAYVKRACDNGSDLEAREALGLATDLGGYAIMIGGTNGAHLTSFSLVDILSHGRACALMNPYYTVFFAPSVEPQLREVAVVLKKTGYLASDTSRLSGRELGLAVAGGLIALSRAIDFPTKLSEVKGFSRKHVTRALEAAKNPQLEMKLKNMPVPLVAAQVDEYMGPILEAAVSGDFGLIRSMP